MKKFLMGTSALVGVTMLAGQAVAAEAPSVSVSGFIDVNIGAGSGESATSGEGGINTDSEIAVSASGKADNGLEYGAKVEIQADQGDTGGADENYMWVSGSWGKVELGNQDGAADQLAVGGPTAATGLGSDGDWADFVNDSVGVAAGLRKATDTGDATKVTYLGGFDALSFGVSFTPNTTGDGDNDANDGQSGGYQSAYEVGVKYSGEANGASYSVGAQYVAGDSDNDSGTNGVLEDLNAWQVGASVSMNGWTVGGAYVDNGDSGEAEGGSNDENDGWHVGVAYATGPWTIAADYASSDDNADDGDAMSIGVTYDVAPGLYVGAELVNYDANVSSTNYDGTVAILTTGVAF